MKHHLPSLLFVIILFFLTLACRQKPASTQRALYHWRTSLALSLNERLLIDSLGVERLYVKFFDVDWDATLGDAAPQAELQADTKRLQNLDITPVVFITNRSLQQLPPERMAMLAQRIHRKLDELWQPLGRGPLREVQLDCDWSGSTREKFFALIKNLKTSFGQTPLQWSATIRLHQLRDYKTTGLPPVDRGMLMFYNMGDVDDWYEPNSILNMEKAEPYLKGARRYPLPLDIALPAFAWGVLFRDGRMIRLLYPIDTAALADTTRFANLGQQRWQLTKSTYLDGHYLYRGDQIRVEAVTPQALTLAAQRLRRALRPQTRTLALYHLDSLLVQRYSYAQLDTTYRLLSLD